MYKPELPQNIGLSLIENGQLTSEGIVYRIGHDVVSRSINGDVEPDRRTDQIMYETTHSHVPVSEQAAQAMEGLVSAEQSAVSHDIGVAQVQHEQSAQDHEAAYVPQFDPRQWQRFDEPLEYDE